MKRLIILLLIALLVAGIVQASGGPVASMEAVPSPLLPIERKVFNDGTLGDNLVAAGEWVNSQDLCTVYAIDYDPGGSSPVEVIYLEECVGVGESQ